MDSRLFIDAYKDPQISNWLNSNDSMADILRSVAQTMKFPGNNCLIVPCQTLPDPGVSGIILAPGFHFTCHTFSQRGMIYIDSYGLRTQKQRATITQEIISSYGPDKMLIHPPDINTVGDFGHHLTFTTPFIPFAKMCQKFEQLVQLIGMHKLSSALIQFSAENQYDILQPIVESHISAHTANDRVELDVFSCLPFDDKQVFSIFSDAYNIRTIPRHADIT